jgi:aconitate hydratase
VRAVIAESFERIHRSNLVNMGVLPLQFEAGTTAASLGLTGRETYTIESLASSLKPAATLTVTVAGDAGTTDFKALVRIETPEELAAFNAGGILPYVLRQLVAKS